MKYVIRVSSIEEYPIKNNKYECADGKVYSSSYSIPRGMDYKESSHETGEKGYQEKEIYHQEVDGLSMDNLIKAVNQLD